MELSVLSDGGGHKRRKILGYRQKIFYFSLDCPNFWHIAWRCSPGNFSAVGSVKIACAFEK